MIHDFKKLRVVFLIFVLLVLVAHAFSIKNQYYFQKQFSEKLLEQAELVSSQLAEALDKTIKSYLFECNEGSIDILRNFANSYLYVYDVGLLEGNSIICTANWGELKNYPELSENANAVILEYEFYSNVDHIFPLDKKLDVTRKANVVAFTSDFSFANFLSADRKFSYALKVKGGDHEFLSYISNYQDSKWFRSRVFDWMSIETAACHSGFNYCAHTFNKRPGLFYYSFFESVAILMICLSFSLLASYAVSSFSYNRRSMEYRLRKAISNRTLYMEYQPIVSARSTEIVGVESLVRWRDDIYGNVSPELFISVAEKIGLYKDVAIHTVSIAIDDMAIVLQRNENFTLSINVSTYEIVDKNFLEVLRDKALSQKVFTKQIKIEITEKIEVPLSVLADFSRRAKSYGFKVSLDDFGTGVSNLVWLTEIDFDDIKIDRVFTQSLNDDFKREMVLSIIKLVSSLNKRLIFEGVETLTELNSIKEYGGDVYIQGWYFYRSMPRDKILSLIDASPNKP